MQSAVYDIVCKNYRTNSMASVAAVPDADPVDQVQPPQKKRVYSCCKRLWKLVKRIINAIIDLFRSPPTLTEKEKQILATYVKYRTLPQHHAYKVSRSNSITALPQSSAPQPDVEPAPDPSELPAALQVTPARTTIVDFAKDLTTMIGEIVFDKKVTPALQQFQADADLLTSKGKHLINFSAPAIGQGSKLIDDVAKQQHRSRGLPDSLRRPLTWLLEECDMKQLQSELEEKFKTDGSGLKFPAKQNLEFYVTPVMNWLQALQKCAGSQAPAPSAAIFKAEHDEEIAERVRGTALWILMDKKMHGFFERAEELIQKQLPDIVKRAMQDNMDKISESLAHRAVDLLEQMQFTETIDKIIAFVRDHINGAVAAEVESTTLFDKVKKAISKLKAGESLPIDFQDIEKDLKTYKEDDCKQKMFFIEFARQKACHKRIVHLIHHLKEHSIDMAKFDRNLGKTFYPTLAETLLDLMLPAKGNVDGFTQIWKKIEMPPEFQGLIDEFYEICSQAIVPDIMQGVSGLRNPVMEVVERYVLTKAKTLGKQHLARLLQTQVEYLVNPARLDELMVSSILPKLTDLLLYSYVCTVMTVNMKKLAPEFEKAHKNPADKKKILIALTKEVMEMAQKNFSEFSLKAGGLTTDDLEKMVTPLVNDLFGSLADARGKKVTSDAFLILREYFLQQEQERKARDEGYRKDESHELYGELFDAAVYKAGESSKGKTITGFASVKRAITAGMLPGFDIARTSYEGIAVLTCDALRRNYFDPGVMENVMFGPVPPAIPPEVTQGKLDEAMDVVGKIAYDLFLQICNREAGGGTFGKLVKGAAGSFLEAQEITSLMKRIYKRIFGARKLLNYNVVFQVSKEMLASLSTAARELQEAAVLDPGRVENMSGSDDDESPDPDE